jgi:hypothetical protein
MGDTAWFELEYTGGFTFGESRKPARPLSHETSMKNDLTLKRRY